MDRALDGLFDVLERTRRLDAPAIDKLEHLVRASVAVLQDRLPYVTLLLRARGNTEVERAALQPPAAVRPLRRRAGAPGRGRRRHPSRRRPGVTARLLFGMVNSLIEWYRPAHSDLADAVCAVAFDGLAPTRGRTMNEAELLTDAFDRIRQSVHNAVDGLTDDQLAHRVDGRANSIAWLVWHLTRIQDDHVAGVAGHDQVWLADGWYDRFGLPVRSRTITATGTAPTEVAAVRASARAAARLPRRGARARRVAYLGSAERRRPRPRRRRALGPAGHPRASGWSAWSTTTCSTSVRPRSSAACSDEPRVTTHVLSGPSSDTVGPTRAAHPGTGATWPARCRPVPTGPGRRAGCSRS